MVIHHNWPKNHGKVPIFEPIIHIKNPLEIHSISTFYTKEFFSQNGWTCGFVFTPENQQKEGAASDWLVNMKIVCNFPLHDWSNCVIVILFRIDHVVKICGKIHPKKCSHSFSQSGAKKEFNWFNLKRNCPNLLFFQIRLL